jgi:DNA-binding transcriptional ArsR family regulator
MARKKVSRTLNRLPPRSVLGSREHRTDRLLEILRDVAVRNQKEQAQPFYSVREIASRFNVPISTVAQTYKQLEREGLLSRVRSSQTILQGSDYDRRLSVRAFIGLPASLPAFVTIQDYRMFFYSCSKRTPRPTLRDCDGFLPTFGTTGRLSEREIEDIWR